MGLELVFFQKERSTLDVGRKSISPVIMLQVSNRYDFLNSENLPVENNRDG
jgi:hypothetical protein